MQDEGWGDMRILVINCGSSSVKFNAFEMLNGAESSLFCGQVTGIGETAPQLDWTAQGGDSHKQVIVANDHRQALEAVMAAIRSKDTDNGEPFTPDAIGHRVVHGGALSDASRIDETVLARIEDYGALAPLHNPPNLVGIRACLELFPGTPNVAVFDTAFHAGKPEVATHYAIPFEMADRYQVYRYGFHGTSHRYVAGECAHFLGRPLGDLRLVTCHLGNGASLAAVKGGRSLDTTMGFTPLEGLMMGTRSGDLDVGAVLYLMEREGLTVSEMDCLLNKQSGLLGVSGVGNDFRVLHAAADEGNKQARLAIDMFVYRIRKHIGALAAVLNGLDALVFTAGIGENDDRVRAAICHDMDYLGISLDLECNRGRKSVNTLLSSADARVAVTVIPTDEERMIARDTLAVLEG